MSTDTTLPATEAPTEASPVQLIELTIRNIMGIEAACIHPRTMTEFHGPNGSGKTSGVKALAMLLSGKADLPDMPIRRGAEKGQIVGEFSDDRGGFTVERRFTKKDSYLSVERKDGSPLGLTSQAFIDTLIGNGVGFDPLALAEADAKTQASMLLRAIGVDPARVKEWRDKRMTERRDINRDLEKAKSALSFLPVPVNPPEERIDTTALTNRAAEIRAQGKLVEQQKKDEERLTQMIVDAERHLEEMKARHTDLQQALREAQSIGNVEAIEQEIKNAQASNKAYEDAKARQAKQTEVNELTTKSEAITKEMADGDEKMRTRLLNANFGVDGLELDVENGVTINGIPIRQASTAEQLTVGVAVGLKSAGRFRFALIHRGESLDQANRAHLYRLLTEAKAQAMVEIVDDSKGAGLKIVNGEYSDND